MKRLQDKYWFTCGWGWDTSEEYRCPVDGHKKEATIHNRMGGSCRMVQNQYIKCLLGNDLVVNNLQSSNIINTTLSKFPSITKSVTIITKGDKDVSQNYIRPQDTYILSNIISYDSQGVLFPNNKQIAPLHQSNLSL